MKLSEDGIRNLEQKFRIEAYEVEKALHTIHEIAEIVGISKPHNFGLMFSSKLTREQNQIELHCEEIFKTISFKDSKILYIIKVIGYKKCVEFFLAQMSVNMQSLKEGRQCYVALRNSKTINKNLDE